MRRDDLVHELLPVKAKTKDRDPQHHVSTDDQIVLTERIINRVERPLVVAAIDLHGKADVLPQGVEVDPAVDTLADDLSRWRRESSLVTKSSEVQLPQGLRPVADVHHGLGKEGDPRS